MPRKDIVIIGAPRSGTNMLRDVLARIPNVGTWPCDEINHIWRHGNVRYPSDIFPPELAKPEVVKYIRGRFAAIARSTRADFLVEKTCANSLRVEFVDRVLPDAKYIFIVRDGLDVVTSAMKRWKSNFDLAYTLRKARYVPLTDFPYYAFGFMGNRVHRLFSEEKRLAFWGPRLDGMESILGRHSLVEACAIQWRECVDRAESAFGKMGSGRVHILNYEAFVAMPEKELERICEFAELPFPVEGRAKIIGHISKRSVGMGRKELGTRLEDVRPLVGDTLRRHGYGD